MVIKKILLFSFILSSRRPRRYLPIYTVIHILYKHNNIRIVQLLSPSASGTYYNLLHTSIYCVFIHYYFFLYILLLNYIVISQPVWIYFYSRHLCTQSLLLLNQTLFGCSSIRSGKCARRG